MDQQQNNQKNLIDKNDRNNSDYKTIKQSKEVYILNNYNEKSFMSLDSNFKLIRELRDKYIHFNDDFPKDFNIAVEQLDSLINIYSKSSLQMFREFSELLKKYHDEICNSFNSMEHYSNEIYNSTISETSDNLRRISNGPIEGFNRKPKDLKRNSRGVNNIRYTINRIIWSNRPNEPIRATPIPIEEVKTHTGKMRGPYKKK